MRSREYLEQVEKIDKLIQNKKYEKEQWLSIAEGTSVSSDGDRVQSSGQPHKMENAVVNAATLDEEIQRLEKRKQSIIYTIEQLKPKAYDILHKKYIQYMSLEEIAEIYSYSYSAIKNKHREALKQLQEILDKRKRHE